jgi:hypothetical protein
VASIIISPPVSAQVPVPTTTPSQTPNTTTATTFSDVEADYWARPFIQAVAERNVITGFPDGTFRPNQPVDRAEFAAMIQKAFNQTQVRQLSAGGFKDVPSATRRKCSVSCTTRIPSLLSTITPVLDFTQPRTNA